jgi:hypothetical protein
LKLLQLTGRSASSSLRNFTGWFACAALLLASTAFIISGQSSRGTVTGLVSDSTKAIVSGATVELTNTSTKVVRSAATNDAGIYRFDAVDLGNYTIKVTGAGFKISEVAPFDVQSAKTTSIDAQLEVGTVSSTVEVSSSSAQIQTEAPVRGGTISAVNMTNLPLASQNPVALALTLPGVSSNRYSFGVNTFSVNGSRGRSNNFLIDGTENNDISLGGQALQITNPDAVQEVAVQTGNYDAEYGRSGSAVVNTITKSGTNEFHGTARYLLESTVLDAPTNIEKTSPAVVQRGHPLPGTDQFFSGTVGGPIVKNKTFFFSSYQEERQVSTSQTGLTTFSAAGRALLLGMYPTGTNPRADLLQSITAGVNANSQFANIPVNGQNIQVGTYQLSYANKYRDRQLLERVDHSFGNNDQLALRYLLDSNANPTGGGVGFPGFNTGQTNETNSALITETHTFSAISTNELRVGYNRIDYSFPFNPTSPLAATTPQTTINGFTGSSGITFGVMSNLPQGRVANNYELQDTISYVQGKHSWRFGTSLLNQRAGQLAPFDSRATLSYQASSGVSGLQNYLDDFGGSGGSASKDFGSAAYYPSLFRQAYFMQDRWRATESLTVTLGVRYEYFGTPVNGLKTPAYAGIFNVNPVTFTGPYSQPNTVNSDLNNWAPTVGLAYSPSSNGLLGRVFGEKKTVFRAGFQMGYDSFFNNIASNAVASSPNNISVTTPSTVSTTLPRGQANLSQAIPATAVLTPLASQTLVLKNLVNPYYMHWSGGFQREIKGGMILDASYVGTRGMELFATESLNPLVPTGLETFPNGYTAANFTSSQIQQRLDPLSGARNIRTNGDSSTYHAGQVSLNRRFNSGFNFNMSYTRSKFIDNGSDIFNTAGNNLPQSTERPTAFGGLTDDKSVSLYDRPNRFVLTSVYQLPFMRGQKGILGHVVGGWQVTGVYTYESGAPLNILAGVDEDGLDGSANDRPEYNPAGTPGVRAVASSTSPTGYVNPDNGNAPISAASAQYIALPACVATLPCAGGNLGRFTARTPPQDNLDTSLSKLINVTERIHLDFRAEFFNVLNHRQYGIVGSSPFDTGTTTIGANVNSTLAGRFLNPGYADGGARNMRFQLKFIF